MGSCTLLGLHAFVCVVTTLVKSSFDDLVPSIFDVSIKERGPDEMGAGTGAREPSTYSLQSGTPVSASTVPPVLKQGE